VAEKKPVTIEKIVSFFTSRDFAICEPALDAVEAVGQAGSFDELLQSHRLQWDHLWNRCDIRLENSDRAQMILRLHIFHLLQTVSRNSIDLDVGVPARGWHGEAYRGHIFWDELFIFPYLNLRIPTLTRRCSLPVPAAKPCPAGGSGGRFEAAPSIPGRAAATGAKRPSIST
jgi:trehalose/maltose hydrolase-like predicted phosphorylase